MSFTLFYWYNGYNAPVAQWIEQETSKLLAVGSIPTRGTTVFMITPLSYTSKFLYRHVAKPVLFRLQPDNVHNGMLAFSKVVQKPRLMRSMISGVLAYKNPEVLEQTIHTITFHNPIGISAGFDKNIEMLPMLRSIGCGLMEGGTITNLPSDGNPRPWFHRLPKTQGLVVHAGLPNHGVDEILSRLIAIPGHIRGDFPLNISMAPSNVAKVDTTKKMIVDCVAGLEKIKTSQIASMITINLSCPNTTGGEPFINPKHLDQLLVAIDTIKLPVPVFLKMPNQLPWEQFDELLRVAVKHNIQGVTIANLVKDRSTIDLKDPLADTTVGGISGRPTFAPSNDLIKKTYQNYGDRLTIIGVGGVFSAADAYEKIKNGASLVELITGMIFEGPGIVGQINRELVTLLRQDGYTHISQAVGANTRAQ